MLKIVGIYPALESELIVDPYVPFDFKAYRDVLPLPYLWNIGNFHDSLLELTIERSTEILRGVTLVNPEKGALADLPIEYETLPKQSGLPIIDRSVLQSDICDNYCSFSLMHKNDAIYVAFEFPWNPSSVIINDRVAFFVQNGGICGIGFLQLRPDEIRLLRKEHFQDI